MQWTWVITILQNLFQIWRTGVQGEKYISTLGKISSDIFCSCRKCLSLSLRRVLPNSSLWSCYLASWRFLCSVGFLACSSWRKLFHVIVAQLMIGLGPYFIVCQAGRLWKHQLQRIYKDFQVHSTFLAFSVCLEGTWPYQGIPRGKCKEALSEICLWQSQESTEALKPSPPTQASGPRTRAVLQCQPTKPPLRAVGCNGGSKPYCCNNVLSALNHRLHSPVTTLPSRAPGWHLP